MTLVRAGLAGVEPGWLVERALQQRLLPDGPVQVLAVGKASLAMLRGVSRILGARVTRALAIGPSQPSDALIADLGLADRLAFIRGDHPMPSTASEQAGRSALQVAANPGEARSLLVLLSGGASALMALPASGLALRDKQGATDRLLRAGVTIHELNTVRKHLSAVKGGRLAATSPVPVLTLAISDVVGDDPGVIGSGPTVADASTFADASAIIERTGGPAAYPAAVCDYLARGARGDASAPESPKPGDPRLAHAQWMLVGGRGEAMRAVAAQARQRHYDVEVRDDAVIGEAREAAREWAGWVARAAARPGPQCLISSGETTVRVTGTGIGGRNQEFALALVSHLSHLGRDVAVASIGTDGVDGPTDSAGAIARTDTLARARTAGLADPVTYLGNNDAWHFFEPLGDLVRTGPTGTNVGDLQICLIR